MTHQIETDGMSAKQQLSARASVYKLLARLWLSEVDGDLLRELHTSPLSDALQAVGVSLPPLENSGDDDARLEQLGIEFCRLFLGPSGHLPPFQSVWTTGQFLDDTSSSMHKFIEIIRYEPAGERPGTMVDHLGQQLDMMGHLLQLQNDSDFESEMLTAIRQISTEFFHAHLTWTTPLLEAAGQKTTSEFYRSLVGTTTSFLADENLEFVTTPGAG